MIKDVIKQTNTLYKENFYKLLSNLIFAVFVYSLIYQMWDHYTTVVEDHGLAISLIANIFLAVMEAIITLTATNILLKNSPFQSINSKVVFIYLFTFAYISIAVLFGLLVLIIPGLFVLSSSMVVQIYILNNGCNPLQAIDNSIELLRGNLIKITISMFCVYVPVGFFILVLAYISEMSGGLYNIFSFISEILIQITTTFYLAAFTVAVYNYCSQHNQALKAQPSAAGTPQSGAP